MHPAATFDNVVLPEDFDVARMTHGVPMTHPLTGHRTIPIRYAGKPLLLQTPEMNAPFGINVWPAADGSTNGMRYSIRTSFKGRASCEPLDRFFRALQEIDAYVVSAAAANSQLWLKRTFRDKDILDCLFDHSVFTTDCDKYAPTFRMALPSSRKDGEFRFPTYGADGRRERVDLEKLVAASGCCSSCRSGVRVRAVVQLSAIWFAPHWSNPLFGLVWKVRRLVVLSAHVGLQESEEVDAPYDDDDDAPACCGRRSTPAALTVPESDDEEYQSPLPV